MANKPHKHAELIKAWADGAVIQFLNEAKNEFEDVVNNQPNWDKSVLYRIKPEPKWIRFNGFILAAPETKPLEKDQFYFIPVLATQPEYYAMKSWIGDKSDLLRLERGLVYLKREDAIARAEAMLNFTYVNEE